MSIRPESRWWLAGSALPAVLFYGLWLFNSSVWALAAFVVSASLLVFFLYFFRDPDREIPQPDDKNNPTWIAPADGIVTEIRAEENRYRIVIFLTVFNVHVNRMPVDGTVKSVEYTSGRFLPAFAGDLEKKNERNRIICEDNRSRSFEVWQIAGMLARRIHFWMDQDDTFKRGQRFGMISLGSRTDLLLPSGVEPTVSENDTVRGGETIVARG